MVVIRLLGHHICVCTTALIDLLISDPPRRARVFFSPTALTHRFGKPTATHTRDCQCGKWIAHGSPLVSGNAQTKINISCYPPDLSITLEIIQSLHHFLHT